MQCLTIEQQNGTTLVISPDSEVRPGGRRRMLAIEYKLRIVAEAERSSEPGAIDAVSVIQDETMVSLTWQAADDILDTAPGVDQRAAYQLLAEMGLNMRQFPTANHLAAWAGVVPGNRQSGGKRLGTRLTDSNRQLRKVPVQCTWVAVRTEGSDLGLLDYRLAARRGKKRAVIAVAHSVLVSLYHMPSDRQPYQNLGAGYFDKHRKGVNTDWLLKQFSKLGYTAHFEPIAAA